MSVVPASVAVCMTAAEARTAVDAIRHDVDDLIDRLRDLWERRAWLALGYESWTAMCTAEFPNRCLPRDERQAIVVQLREVGMSTRAIAAATGAHHTTIVRAAGGANAPRVNVTGTDGKSYPATVEATTTSDIELIRDLAKLGLSAAAIADRLGLTTKQVYAIAKANDIAVGRNSRAARTERIERTRQLAAEGATSHQIAAELGVGFEVIRKYSRESGIVVPADSVTSSRTTLDSARIVEGTVRMLDGIDAMFDHINYDALPAGEVNGWVTVLETSIRSLTTLKKHLKELTQP